MNYRMIGRLMGIILRIMTALMLPALLISAALGENGAVRGLIWTMAIMLILSLPPALLKPKRQALYAREGFALVGLAWIMLSLLGALPFLISGAIPSYIDCFFETVSGFTTTGASILTDVEAMPKGLLYWRSFTHWVGGMGVLVFLLAVVPLTAGSGEGLYIMRAESPGPQVGKLAPRTLKTARYLYVIYVGMTLLQTALMLLGGMPLFDAVTTAFGTAGTGGFGVRSDSIAGYSPYLQTVIAVFMALFGVNFSVYYLLIMRQWRRALKSEELRVYFIIMLAAIGIIVLDILPLYEGDVLSALRNAGFQVSSIMTTTGFATADFNTWPQLSRALLVLLMIIGACAGSTGGGVKCSRIMLSIKSLRVHLRKLLHPNTVRHVRMDAMVIPTETMNGVSAFFTAYAFIAILSTLIISLDDFSFETNLTAVLACLNNIGPGLGLVGPMGSFSGFSDLSKLALSANMLIGRLEIFPILLLFVPSVWKRARA